MLASNPLIQVTPGLMIWTIVCFLVVLFVLKSYAFGPIQQMIDERRERIEQAIAEADNARDEARSLLEEHRKLIGQAKIGVGGDPRRGAAHRRVAARARPGGDRRGSPAAPRGDAAPDRAGDAPGARRDPRGGRQAQPARGREDHAQVAHRRRPEQADRRGARRDRLQRARREPVVAVAHRIYARAVFEAAQDAGSLDAVHGELQQLRDAFAEAPDLEALLENPEVDSRVKADVLARVAAGSDEHGRQLPAPDRREGARGGDRGDRRRARRARRSGEPRARRRADDRARALRRGVRPHSRAGSRPASGRKVQAERKVDPDLIGGIVLQAGSMRLDASVRGRLERLRHDLTHARS